MKAATITDASTSSDSDVQVEHVALKKKQKNTIMRLQPINADKQNRSRAIAPATARLLQPIAATRGSNDCIVYSVHATEPNW